MYIYIWNSHLRICLLISFLRDRGRERKRKKIDVREEHWSVASLMSPDQQSNSQPFGVWDNAPTTWVTRPAEEVCTPFITFSCLTALARTSGATVHRATRVNILVSFLIFGEKLSVFHYQVWCSLWYMPFLGLTKSLLVLVYWVFLSWKSGGFCRMFILCLLR